jgi:peptidoglycan/LPS O-acetylase OafA/YrhL
MVTLPSRLNSLDAARGIASLSVVLCHWQHFFYESGKLPEHFNQQAQPLYGILAAFYEHGGHIAVPFFFTLSGFVFFWLYREKFFNRSCSLASFAISRFARLYPLHIVTLVAVLVLQLVFLANYSSYFVYTHNDAYHFILNLIFGSYWGFEKGWSFNAPIWSVSIEIGLYAAFFMAAYLGTAGWKSTAAWVATLVVLPYLGLASGRWIQPLECFFLGGLTFYALDFYFHHPLRSKKTDHAIIVTAVSSWVLMFTSHHFSMLLLNHFQLYSRVLFPLTIFGLILLECSDHFDFRRIKWMGDITYSSYLLHFPLQLIFYMGFMFMGFDRSVFHSPWMLALFFAVLVPLSLASFHYFELPMQRLIRGKASKFTRSDQRPLF